jgi:hypothetical protein
MKSLTKNSMYSMTGASDIAQPMRVGEQNLDVQMSYNPMVREMNQMKTMSQVQNYAASKEMATQGRTDMRGNVSGYSDTLG